MKINNKNKFYLEAEIKLHEETAALKERASSAIKLPDEKNKQPDLLYFSAIFVSSGENLNHAYFLPSELVKSEGTIVNKAVDMEHKESEVVGHIYEHVFIDKDGSPLNLKELVDTDAEKVDRLDVHVAIAGILYKSRFPNLAEEVAQGKWKVSMEAYFHDFDIKVGDLIMSRKEAEALGFASGDEGMFGKLAKIIKNGAEIASGTLTRVLRGIVFSGMGIVMHPANPASVVLETANNKMSERAEIILNYDELDNKEDNKLTSINIEGSIPNKEDDTKLDHKDEAELQYNDTVGICVSFKKEVIDATFKGPDTKILHTNWCTLYEKACTSFSRDTTDPKCLKNKIREQATVQAKKLLKTIQSKDKRKVLVSTLLSAFDKAEKYL